MNARTIKIAGALAIAGVGVWWLTRRTSSSTPASASPAPLLSDVTSSSTGASSFSPYQVVMSSTPTQPTATPAVAAAALPIAPVMAATAFDDNGNPFFPSGGG